MWKNPEKWSHAWKDKHIHPCVEMTAQHSVFSSSSCSTPLPRSRPAPAPSRMFPCSFVCMHACVQWVLARPQRLASGIGWMFRLRGVFPVLSRLSGRIRSTAELGEARRMMGQIITVWHLSIAIVAFSWTTWKTEKKRYGICCLGHLGFHI